MQIRGHYKPHLIRYSPSYYLLATVDEGISVSRPGRFLPGETVLSHWIGNLQSGWEL